MDIEWLRAGGMLVVFAIHVAEPFNPWDAWHVTSPERSKWLGELVFFAAPWIMPLFMTVAGSGAAHALVRRSRREYVRERLLRIGLPLAAGILVLVPPQVWLERRLRGEFSGSLLAFYPRFFDGIYPRGNFSWHHLWFLVFLLVFAIATLPLLEWLRGPVGGRLLSRFAARCQRAGGLVWLVLPAIAVRVLLELAFEGFTPLSYDWSNRGLLLPAFLMGFAIEQDPGLRRAVDRRWRVSLGTALAVSAVLVVWAWPGHVLDRLPRPRSGAGVLLWAGYACGAWCWTLALMGVAHRHLTRGGKKLARASELAYPFYVLHHPVVIAAAYVAVRRGLGLVSGVLVVAVGAFAVTVALCGAVGSVPWLRVLFGLRPGRPEASPPPRPAAAAP